MKEKNILITGNGFDLSVGLKTSYADFIIQQLKCKEEEIENLVNNLNELVSFQQKTNYILKLKDTHTSTSRDNSIVRIYSNSIKELINIYKINVNWTEFYNLIKPDDFKIFEITDYSENNIRFFEKGIKVNDELVKKYNLLFKQVSNNNYYSFIDEFSVLNQNNLPRITEYNSQEIVDINIFNNNKKVLLELCDFFEKVDKIKKYINTIKKNEYLMQYFIWEFKFNNQNNKDNWSDIETFILKIITEKVSKTATNNNHKWLFDLIMVFKTDIDPAHSNSEEWFIKQIKINIEKNIQELESCFDSYIQNNISNEISSLEISPNSNFENFIKSIDYQLNFNYTNTLEVIQKSMEIQTTKVRYIHNKYGDSKNDNNRIIFGIDKYIEIESKEEIPVEHNKFVKENRIIHSIVNQEVLPLINLKNNEMLNIHFWGHGLAHADHSYFDSIFKKYDIFNNSNVKLIFYWYDKQIDVNKAYSLINKISRNYQKENNRNSNLTTLILENRIQFISINEIIKDSL